MKLFSLALVATVVCADVTMRYSMTVEPGSAVPAAAAEKMKEQMKGMLGGTTLQVKGNRSRVTGMGMTSITDFDGAIITILDEAKKQYATASQKQYFDAVKTQVPKPKTEEEAAMANLKMDTAARKTGRHRQIHGLDAEETALVMTMQLPGMPFRFKADMSVWTPAGGENSRNKALAEITAYSQRAWTGMDTTAMMKNLMAEMPGGGEGMLKFVDALKESGVILEMNAEMSMPGFRELLKNAPPEARAEIPEGTDDVLLRMTQKLEEFSAKPLPESLFTVPRSYTGIDLSEMLPRIMPSAK